ncbi:MAG: aminopeptidase P N-terminal domain-containing protein [Bacteroidota bacterium]
MYVMKTANLPQEFFIKNRSKLYRYLQKGSVAFFCASHEMPRNGDQYYPFRQHSDFYYLTGINQEDCIVMLAPFHPDPNQREILFIKRTTAKNEIWFGKKLNPDSASEISGIHNVRWMEEFFPVVADVIAIHDTLMFNLNEYNKFHPAVRSADEELAGMLTGKFPAHGTGRLAPIMTRLRILKEPEEITRIREACQVTEHAFRKLLPEVKPEMMEYEIEAHLSFHFLASGSEGHAYPPIVAGGERALTLHYNENSRVCKDGELVLIDFGAEVGHYAADCTRTIPLNGRFTPRQRELYEANLRVLKASIAMMRPGTRLNEFNEAVGKLWEEEHIRLGLYTAEEAKRRNPSDPLWKVYYMHGTSHCIGLDVHDPYDLSVTFAEGMVFSCEPAIYIPEEGIAIRLENDILITSGDPVDLMASLPIEPDEIEDLMNR